jgi:hypothetical protein
MELVHVVMYGTRCMMELEGGTTLHNFSASSSLLPTLPNTSIYIFEKEEEIPRVDDI